MLLWRHDRMWIPATLTLPKLDWAKIFFGCLVLWYCGHFNLWRFILFFFSFSNDIFGLKPPRLNLLTQLSCLLFTALDRQHRDSLRCAHSIPGPEIHHSGCNWKPGNMIVVNIRSKWSSWIPKNSEACRENSNKAYSQATFYCKGRTIVGEYTTV